MAKPEDTEWDEFKDSEIVDWKRIRTSIEHENLLTNHRFTWLLTSQGFLVTAFLVIWQSSLRVGITQDERMPFLWILSAISFLAFFMSIHLSLGLLAAHEHHKRLQAWWDIRKGMDKDRHPPICGSDPTFFRRIPYYVLGAVFAFTWLVFTAVVFFNYLQQFHDIISKGIGVIVLVAIGILIGRLWKRKRPESATH